MRQKPFRLFSRVALVLLMMMLTATSAWATITGSGTEADPYVINTEDDWNTAATTMQYYYNSSSYVYIKLGADLNFSGKTFNMYGNYDNKIHFDGQGYTISGITIDKPSGYPAAPFYWLNSGGSISRLTIANSTIYAYDHVAGIVAYNAGTISDCHVASSVTLKVGDTYCGGIVAHNYMPISPSTAGTVTGCTVAARLQLPYRQYNSVSLGGIVGAQNSAGTISNCLFYGSMEVDKGGTTTLFGCITEYNHGTITGNCYCPIGTYHAFKSESDTDGAAAVSKVSGIPDGVTVSSAATYTYGGNTYCTQNAVTTITPPANTAFRTFTATGATYSLAADKRSASLTLGTSDATVTATLQTIGGSCGDNASWTLTQDGDGNYTRLTISGTGEMNDYTHITNGKDSYWRTSAAWGYDLTSVTIPDGITSIGDFAFCGCQQLSSITIGSSVQNIGYASINHCDGLTTVELPASVNSIEYAAFENCVNLARVNIGKSDGVITGENPFNGCHANLIIAVPTPALVLQYKAASILSGYASKLRAAFGSQVFNAIGTVSDAAYEIANADDLRHLATAVNQDHQGGNGLTFRQTDDITLTGAFTPIGYNNESWDKQFFYGTYDGGEYTITGLSVSGDYYYAGLFGSVDAGGTVKNARLISPIVTSSFSGAHVAALIGKANECTIENCLIVSPTVSATTSRTSNMVGALVGHLDCATVQNCFVISPTVSAEGSTQKGAICGYAYSTSKNYYCTLTNVYYYDCSLDAIGWNNNYPFSKLTNVGRAHLITLGSGVTGVSPAATAPENGFVYDSKTYYREGAELTLASNLSATGKHAIFKTGGKTYTVNSTDGDVTLAAELTYNTYTVTFDGNGGTRDDGEMADMHFTYDTAQPLTANAFTRTGYAFAGWATSTDGDVLYEDKEGVSNLTDTDDGTVTLYAKWTANTYTVKFNGNGNTGGSMADMNFTYDVEQNLTANAFTRKGYAFAGWATSTDGDVVYTDQQSVSNLTDTDGGTVTLYAKWVVPYIDADGHTQTCSNFTVLTNTTNLDTGWYVVTEDVNYNSDLYCYTGDIHLILCDGAKMTVTVSGASTIFMSSGNLTIYAQSTGSSMGQLVATASDAHGIYVHGNINICGGNITVMSNSSDEESDAENFGIYATGSVTIHSGQVSASGKGYGICAKNGSITLGLRNATDYITATDYYGTVNIADGQTLTDGTIFYSGNNVIAPAFRTLRLLLQTLALSDNGNNAEAIGEAAAASAGGRLYNVTLSGRTLYKDGYWNTLVLPFDVTIASSPLTGDNVVAKVLSTTSKLDNGTLTLNFSDAPAKIPAGTPFIIKWDNTGVNLVNPVFTGVTIDNTNRDVNFTGGSFMGTYAPLEITDANRSKVLLLSGGNKLGYAMTDRTIANGKALGTCRAYFYFPGSQTARSFVMNFEEEGTPTGVGHTEITESTEMAGAIYDLQGRHVEKAKKGLYIVNGKKKFVR